MAPGKKGRHDRNRPRRGRLRLSADRLGKAPRPARRGGGRGQEVVELNSKVPVRDERKKKARKARSKTSDLRQI